MSHQMTHESPTAFTSRHVTSQESRQEVTVQQCSHQHESQMITAWKLP
jgi:hypothetical protein